MASIKTTLTFSSDAGITDVSPLYESTEYLYVKAEYVDGNDDYDYNPYEIIYVFTKTDGTDVVGADGVSLADSTATPDVSTVDEDVTNDTNVLFPFFYRVRNVNSGKYAEYHETEIKNLAGVQARVGAASATWTDPA